MIKRMKIIFVSNILESIKLLIATTAPSGLTLSKIAATFKISMMLAPITLLKGFDFWYLENAVYLNFVVGAIFVDWVLGTIKHALWLHDFKIKYNLRGVLVKLLLTVSLGAVFEGLKYLTMELNFVTKYFMVVLRVAVFMYPAMSIIRSSRVISDGKFPPERLFQRIENWTDELIKKQKDV